MNNLFLFDIDGTLSLNGVIPNSAKKALEALREKGDYVLLATGRCLGQMADILADIKIDGAILNNGGLLVIGDEVLFESPISNNTIRKMINDGLHIGLLVKDDYVRPFDHNDIYDRFSMVFSIKPPRMVDDDYIYNNKAYSLGVYADDLESVKQDRYPDLRFVRVCDLGYDVMNKVIDKSAPMKVLRDRFKEYRIIAFGDNYNDIEMLKKADISVCMRKAPKEVKAISNYETLDVFEDGIEYALKDILQVL